MGIAVGNFLTGRCRALVQDTLAGSGGGEHNHVHPYLTADNRHVVFNANPYFGPTQVFAARVPDDFLSSLDAPRAK